jgi:ribonuclease P protein component
MVDGRSESRRRRRLTRSGDFDRVYREGVSRGNRYLVLYAFGQRDDDDVVTPRLGVSVGRKVGRAVKRNKMKRALREAFWGLSELLPDRHDFVIVARPGSEELVDREGAGGLREQLASLLVEAFEDGSKEERNT